MRPDAGLRYPRGYAEAATEAPRQLTTAFTATAAGTRSDDHFAWGRRYYAKGGFFTWGRGTAARLSALSMSGNYVNEQSDTAAT